ncbi:MAG: hypothetical protein IAE80_23045 [Anaerolinea sp.]|nr:hypothetical protein [Anaerolinea sp.]
MLQEKPKYDENSVKPLDPREHMRLRPGMYVGGTDLQALNNWLEWLLQHAVQQVFQEHADHVRLFLKPDDQIEIIVNGHGLRISEFHGTSEFEMAMTMIGTGAQWGLFGVIPLQVVNALAAECIAEVKREGFLWRQEYREGKPLAPVLRVRGLDTGESNGTRIMARPDYTLFEKHSFSYETWAARLHELACLFPRTIFSLHDERTGQADNFYFPDGLASYLNHANRDRTTLHPPLYSSSTWRWRPKDWSVADATVDVAIQYCESDETVVIGYLNTQRLESGRHLDVAPELVMSLINEQWFFATPFSSEQVKRGLTMVINAFHPYVRYQGSTRYRVTNSDLIALLADAVEKLFPQTSKEKAGIEAKLRANGAFDDEADTE